MKTGRRNRSARRGAEDSPADSYVGRDHPRLSRRAERFLFVGSFFYEFLKNLSRALEVSMLYWGKRNIITAG